MKKLFKKIFFLSLILSLTGCFKSLKPGTYESEGKGHNKDKKIKISVVINDDKKIESIKVLDHGETDELGGVALESLVKDAVEKNSDKIDVIAGATETTEGFKEALNNALEEARNAK